MNIFVLATACHSSGARTIYRQFLSHIDLINENNTLFVFIEESMEVRNLKNINFIKVKKQNWLSRIYWIFFDLQKWVDTHKIKPDLIISLQNIGTTFNCPQLIYYHQPIPLSEKKWNPFIKKERSFFFYKHFYLLFVKSTINNKTVFVTQIESIKQALGIKLHIEEKKIKILFPDIQIRNLHLQNKFINKYTFIYPATYIPYKEHLTLVKSMVIVAKKRPDLLTKIRILFTLSEEEAPDLLASIIKEKLEQNFQFIGKLEYDKLLHKYSECNALLFPSTIETLGLPLLEASSFGRKILVSNSLYAHEVLTTYSGATYIESYNFEKWADQIIYSSETIESFPPYRKNNKSSWTDFYSIAKQMLHQ